MASEEAAALRQAITALYGYGGGAGAANQWLNSFSKSPAAWSACLELVQPSEQPEVAFFAANMLLSKVRAEWHKLSGEQQSQMGATIRWVRGGWPRPARRSRQPPACRCCCAVHAARWLRRRQAGLTAGGRHCGVVLGACRSPCAQHQVPAVCQPRASQARDATAGVAVGSGGGAVGGGSVPGVCGPVREHDTWRRGRGPATRECLRGRASGRAAVCEQQQRQLAGRRSASLVPLWAGRLAGRRRHEAAACADAPSACCCARVVCIARRRCRSVR